MLLHPIENTAVLKSTWVQVRPRITQLFGKNRQIYAQFGMDGHNGIDFGVPAGTPIFSPCDGKVKVKKDTGGYGIHVKIRSHHGAREIVLGHLSKLVVTDGQSVNMGDQIGESGNTGFSTGPHLHMGLRFLTPQQGEIFSWPVANYDNGFFGYVDFLDKLITFKGTHTNSSISK